MARPRTHEIDSLLDAAESLLAAEGISGLTIRALSESTGASSGMLYHAFGSRSDLLGQVWLRAARLFLTAQEEAINRELSDDPSLESAVAATIAVASVPASLGAASPASAAVLLRIRRDEILRQDLSTVLREEIERLDEQLLAVLIRLSDALWGRHDRPCVETVAVCVVDLPTAILISRRKRVIDPLPVLENAVRGVLAAPRPERP